MARAAARKFDDAATYGPAMAALSNNRQRAFVSHFIITGVAAQAARKAGYGVAGSSNMTLGQVGYRLLQDDRIQAAIAEESRKYLRAAAPAAVRLLHRVIDDPQAKDQDRLRAADAVLTRSDPVTSSQIIAVQHEHRHRHELTADQVTARILELAGRVGVKLPPPPMIIDATATEIPA
jgi:phage terminase small subunit